MNFADDFVILSRGHASAALAWTRWAMKNIGLTLNETKTSIRDARSESFDFLGYTFGTERIRKSGQRYMAAQPSKKSVRRCKQRIRQILDKGNLASWTEVADQLNSVLRGWSNYYSYGTRLMAYRAIDWYIDGRVRSFLRRRHQVASRATRQFPNSEIYGKLGVIRLRTLHVGERPA